MNPEDPFDLGQGYTVYRDGPKTNGGSGQQKDNGSAHEASEAKGSTEPITGMYTVLHIPGMIPIGPFSRIDAVTCRTFQ